MRKIIGINRLRLFGYVLVMGATLSLTGCADPSEIDFTRTRPSIVDLAGRWIPTAGNVNARFLGHSLPMTALDLSSDGGFSVVDLPTSPDLPGASADGLLT